MILRKYKYFIAISLMFLAFSLVSLIIHLQFGKKIETYVDTIHWRLFSLLFQFFLFLALGCLVLAFIKQRMPGLYKRLISWIRIIAIIVGAILLSVLFLELLTRALEPAPDNPLDLRDIHRPSLYPGVLYDLKPGVTKIVNRKNSGRIEYKINDLGFRGKSYSLKKPEHVFRILTMGDSISFGIDISEQERYTEILEKMLNEHYSGRKLRFEAINMSVGGWNTYNQLSWLSARGLEFQPDLILWQFHENDVDDPLSHLGANTFALFKDIPREYFPNPDDPAIKNNIFIRRPKDFSSWEILSWYGAKYSRVYKKLAVLWTGIHSKTSPPHEGKVWLSWCLEYLQDEKGPQWQWLKSNFEKIKHWSEEHNCPVSVLIVPLAYQLNSDLPLYREPLQKLEKYFRSMGFTVVNVTERLEHESRENPFRYYLKGDASHPNAEGQKIIAEEILSRLTLQIDAMLKKRQDIP